MKINLGRSVGAAAAIAAVASMFALAAPGQADQSNACLQKRHAVRYYHMSEFVGSANAVIVGGTSIMRFHFSAGGFTPDERASETTQRLNDIMATGPIAASDITVQSNGGDAVVLVKGELLFTADSATADFNDSTPIELANEWADQMRDKLPGLTEAK